MIDVIQKYVKILMHHLRQFDAWFAPHANFILQDANLKGNQIMYRGHYDDIRRCLLFSNFLNSLVIIFGKKEPKIEQDCEMAQFLPLGPQLLKYGRFLPKLSCHIVSLTSVMEGSGCGAVGKSKKICSTCVASFHSCLTIGPIQLFICFY